MRAMLTLCVLLNGCSDTTGPSVASTPTPDPYTITTDTIDGVPRVTIAAINSQRKFVVTPDEARAIGQILVNESDNARRSLAGSDGSHIEFKTSGGCVVRFVWKLQVGLIACVQSDSLATQLLTIGDDQCVPLGTRLLSIR